MPTEKDMEVAVNRGDYDGAYDISLSLFKQKHSASSIVQSVYNTLNDIAEPSETVINFKRQLVFLGAQKTQKQAHRVVGKASQPQPCRTKLYSAKCNIEIFATAASSMVPVTDDGSGSMWSSGSTLMDL